MDTGAVAATPLELSLALSADTSACHAEGLAAEKTSLKGSVLSQPGWQQLKKSTKDECEPPVRPGAWQDSSEQCRSCCASMFDHQSFLWLLSGAELHGGGGEAETTNPDLPFVPLLADKLVVLYWSHLCPKGDILCVPTP